MQPLRRVCFCLQVKRDRLDEYKERHQTVWPGMLDALRRSGWRNYSLFLREDGLLIGYLETENFKQALAGMATADVNTRWQREMASFFENTGGKAADESVRPLEEVFHLD